MKKQFLLGLMAMSLPLTTWAQNQLTIEVDGVDEWVYDGGATKPHFNVSSNKGDVNGMYEITYTLTNGKGTDQPVEASKIGEVGVYTATATATGLIEGTYENASAQFTITPKELTKVDIRSITKMYGSDNISFIPNSLATEDGNLTGDELTNALQCLTYAVVGDVTSDEVQKAEAGRKFQVTVSGLLVEPETAVCNYYYSAPSSGNTTYEMEITKRPLTVDLTGTWKTYDAKATALTTLAASKKITYGEYGIVGDEAVTITLTDNENNKKNFKDAGEYKLIVSLADGNPVNNNYKIANENGIAVYNIARATLEITQKGDDAIAITYGDETPLTDKFNFNFPTQEETKYPEVVARYVMKATGTGGVAGNYTAQLYYTNDDDEAELIDAEKYTDYLPNYDIEYTPVAVKVNAADISEAEITLANTTYQGKAFDWKATYTDGEGEEAEQKPIFAVTLNGQPLEEDSYDVTLTTTAPATEGAKATNAGDKFTITVKGKNNYTGQTSLEEQTITKAPLSIDPVNATALTKVYDGKDVENSDLTTQFTFKGLVGNDNTDPVTVFSMKKNAGANVIEGGYWVNIYDSESKLVDPTQYTSETVTEGHPNYIITFNRNSCKYIITKKPLTYHIAEATKKYDGYTTLPDGGFTVASEDFVEADLDEDGNIKTGVFTVAPTVELTAAAGANVGEYDLKVTNADKVEAKNYEVTYTTDENDGVGKYTITKADLDLTILPQTVDYIAAEEADLEIKLEYGKNKVEGATVHVDGTFRTSDKNAVEALLKDRKLVYSKEGIAQQVGLHEGGLTLDVDHTTLELQNFNINFTAGDLLVDAKHEITLDRDAVDDPEEGTKSVKTWLEAYNGVEEMTVILGGNRNLNPDYWYTLVLPFEATVREISNAFGYAVVNVPNKNNTDAGVVSFKLKVDATPIEANTLILIKTDEAINLEQQIKDDKAVKFEGKTIVYDPEYYTEDAAENKYYGVYETTPLQDDGYWYLSGGKFYNAGAYYRAYDKPLLISALGGYVHAVAGAAARILVEEPDGSTTSINAVTGETTNSADSWYSVDGMKLNAQPTQKGVYINNGKKVVIK